MESFRDSAGTRDANSTRTLRRRDRYSVSRLHPEEEDSAGTVEPWRLELSETEKRSVELPPSTAEAASADTTPTATPRPPRSPIDGSEQESSRKRTRYSLARLSADLRQMSLSATSPEPEVAPMSSAFLSAPSREQRRLRPLLPRINVGTDDASVVSDDSDASVASDAREVELEGFDVTDTPDTPDDSAERDGSVTPKARTQYRALPNKEINPWARDAFGF